MAVPTETQIVEAAQPHLSGDKTDLQRLLTLLELENDWTDVSLKRFSGILSKHELLPTTPSSSSIVSKPTTTTASSSGSKKKKKKTDTSIPKSFIDPSLTIPPTVRAVYFDAVKGKGLVSARSFSTNDVLFTENAYIATPPPEALPQIKQGELCGQCFLPISSAPVALAIKNCPKCKYRFCTSTCHRTAMATHHTLLCPGFNGEAKELMDMIEGNSWQSLHCVARSLARLMGTLTPAYNGSVKGARGKEEGGDLTGDYGDFEEVYGRLSSFATVSELERRQRNPGWSVEKSTFEPLLVAAYNALRLALDPFHPARKPNQAHHIDASLITSSRKSQLKDLFDQPTYLKLLGRSNINMEKFGGLYSLHSFLNHSCSPNVSIKHMPERGISSSMHIAAVATRPIQPDEELLISYINPETTVGRRQLLLYRDYCFGPCTCQRCTDELAQLGLVWDAKLGVKGFLDSVARKTGETDDKAENKARQDANLEEELRASLGF